MTDTIAWTRAEIVRRLEYHLTAAEELRASDTTAGRSRELLEAAAYGYLRTTIQHLVSDLEQGVV